MSAAEFLTDFSYSLKNIVIERHDLKLHILVKRIFGLELSDSIFAKGLQACMKPTYLQSDSATFRFSIRLLCNLLPTDLTLNHRASKAAPTECRICRTEVTPDLVHCLSCPALRPPSKPPPLLPFSDRNLIRIACGIFTGRDFEQRNWRQLAKTKIEYAVGAHKKACRWLFKKIWTPFCNLRKHFTPLHSPQRLGYSLYPCASCGSFNRGCCKQKEVRSCFRKAASESFVQNASGREHFNYDGTFLGRH
jgi:hypothetical protein